ncbi:MAG: hypothetical protein IPK82_11120 [Polyangiaceae bacterium]|nr:hypothetical protein [Polyangiaceae bacterium]
MVRIRGNLDVEFENARHRLPAADLPEWLTQGTPLELRVTIEAQHTFVEWARAYAGQGVADLLNGRRQCATYGAVAGVVGAGAARRTARDLVRLLQEAPRPDDAYLDAVTEIAQNQPTLPETPWG